MSNPTDNQITNLRTAIDALMRRFKIAEIAASESKPLNQIDIQVMFYVSKHSGCGPTDVARYLSVAPTTVSSVTDRLTKQNFLHRDRPEENRRSIALSLTEAGNTYVSKLIDVQKNHCRDMLEPLSADEKVDFIKLMTKVSRYEY